MKALVVELLCHLFVCRVHAFVVVCWLFYSKEVGKYQESIQSSTTPDPGHHIIWESDKITRKHHPQESQAVNTWQFILLCFCSKTSSWTLLYLKPLKTQLIQILFLPIHSNVIPFVYVLTSFPNWQERFSKAWAWLRTSAKKFGEKCQIHHKVLLIIFRL